MRSLQDSLLDVYPRGKGTLFIKPEAEQRLCEASTGLEFPTDKWWEPQQGVPPRQWLWTDQRRDMGWVLIKLHKRPLATTADLLERTCMLFSTGMRVAHGCFPASFPLCQPSSVFLSPLSPFWLGQLLMNSYSIRYERKSYSLSCNLFILELNNSKIQSILKKTLGAINNLKSTYKLHSEWFLRKGKNKAIFAQGDLFL